MIKLSVIVCTQNPRASYVARVLEALRNQSLPWSEWELLIVDHASREPAASQWELSWHPNARYCFEGKSGIGAARRRGIREAVADLLVFLSDDVILDAGYLVEAIRIGGEWPRLGVWGSGATHLECETEPPEHLQRLLPLLGFRDNKLPCWGNIISCFETLPSGAGLCARKDVAATYCRGPAKSPADISTRLDSLQLGGEEEFGYASCSMGFGIGVFPSLKLTRLILREQLTEIQLLQLHENRSVSRLLLSEKWNGNAVMNPLSPLGLLEAIKNIVLHRSVERRMYISDFRAALKARRLIAADRSMSRRIVA